VARKTANVVRGVAYGLADGVVVDTHVRRIARRLGWTKQTDPGRIERDLMLLHPPASWMDVGHLLIHHGRRTCGARKPDCPACPVRTLCPSAGGAAGAGGDRPRKPGGKKAADDA
jgi:endonuclease-3